MNTNPKNVKDDDIEAFFFTSLEESLTDKGLLDDLIRLKELQERRLFLVDEISDDTVTPIVKAIMRYNIEDKGKEKEERKPIILYLDTVGGEVTSGYRLIDTIVWSKTPVHIVNMGTCYSMGFYIFIAGDVRYASKNARFLLHDGTTGCSNSTGKARDFIEFNDRVESRIRDDVLTWTNITKDIYDSKIRTEWYMFADEAKSLGIVDKIVGIDCEFDEII